MNSTTRSPASYIIQQFLNDLNEVMPDALPALRAAGHMTHCATCDGPHFGTAWSYAETTCAPTVVMASCNACIQKAAHSGMIKPGNHLLVRWGPAKFVHSMRGWAARTLSKKWEMPFVLRPLNVDALPPAINAIVISESKTYGKIDVGPTIFSWQDGETIASGDRAREALQLANAFREKRAKVLPLPGGPLLIEYNIKN